MKRCAVINDISGFGKCSLSAQLPILATMGIEAVPMPTAVLSNQTAYDSYHMVDLTQDMPSFIGEWQKLGASFDAILTGFVANENQFDYIFDFISKFKSADTLLIVDPIMADDGMLYSNYNKNMCSLVKQLCLKANLITPNCTELAILCDKPYSTNHNDIIAYAKSLITSTLSTVIVTGVVNADKISNICVSKDSTIVIDDNYLGGSYSGTGDIFTAIICSSLLKGKSVQDGTQLAQSFIAKSIKNTVIADYRNGIDFENNLKFLL